MGEGWTRLPGGGWMREMALGITLAAEAEPGGLFRASVWRRESQLFRCPFAVADAAHAAGVALGWWLAMANAAEGGA